jgi:hypothetical protein
VHRDPLPEEVGAVGLADVVEQGRAQQERVGVGRLRQEPARHAAGVVAVARVHREVERELGLRQMPRGETVVRVRQARAQPAEGAGDESTQAEERVHRRESTRRVSWSAMRAFPLLLALLLGLALAQPPAPAAPTAPAADATATPAAPTTLDERGWPTGPDAAEVADAAVAAWLVREPLAVADLTAMTPAEACLRLPDLVSAPPPPRGTRVITEDRRAVPIGGPDDDRAAFTYAAVRPTDALDVVQVDLVRVDDTWQVQRVGFRAATGPTGVRAWLQTPPASIAFVLVTLVVVLGLVRPSPLRRALAFGLRTARAHRTTIVVTMVLLYAVFGLGALSGAALPPSATSPSWRCWRTPSGSWAPARPTGAATSRGRPS